MGYENAPGKQKTTLLTALILLEPILTPPLLVTD